MLAVSLLLFAPSVSRVLVAFSPMPAMSMAAGVAQHHAVHAPGKCAHDPLHGPALPSTDACGYCSLLFHSPALAATVLVLLPLALPAATAHAQAMAFHAPVLRLLDRRSRGPPLA